MRRRLDLEMVRRGVARSRAESAALIADHRVTVGGALATKVSSLVSAADPIEILGPPRDFVGRGGQKLAGALASFAVDVLGRSVIDAGSSTGGFTDCLLKAGARRVAGFDVGRNQLHESLRADPRVVQRDGFNVRHIRPEDLPFPCSLFVADLSFISLTLVLPGLTSCVSSEASHPNAEAIVLVKPQFEVGRREAAKGAGVVTDRDLHRGAVESVASAFTALGWSVAGSVESPIRGAEGNTEFLVWAQAKRSGRTLGQNQTVEEASSGGCRVPGETLVSGSAGVEATS